MEMQTAGAASGWRWIQCGWRLFSSDFGNLFLIFLVFAAIAILLNMIPLIGAIAYAIISPVLIGGFMHAFKKRHQGGAIGVNDLFAGFQDPIRRNRLLMLGVLYLVAEILLVLIISATMGDAIKMAMEIEQGAQIDPAEIQAASGSLLGSLVMLIIGTIYAMAFLYAPILIMFDDVKPLESTVLSFKGALKNMLPLLVFGLILIPLAVLAMLPMGLGMLILLPVLLASIYCSYESIYHT